MKRLTFVVLAMLAVQTLASGKPKPEGMADAMKKAHKGKESPFQKLAGERFDLKEELTWKEIARYAEELGPMRDLMVEAKVDEKQYHWHWGVKGYDSGLKELQAAIKAEDRKEAQKAFKRLHVSCAMCHGYYSPGFGRK
jgi:hypothetical protein